MASEDVIELGSSDDDAEPAPKKKKRMPDAMVHIPSKLPGVTIKPAKSTSFSSSKLLTKPIIVNKTNLKVNPITRVNTPIRVPIHNEIVRNAKNNPIIYNKVPIVSNKIVTINPLSSIAQNLSKRHVILKKVSPTKLPRHVMQIMGGKVLNHLPPSITIKPIQKLHSIRPTQNAGASGMHKKKILVGPKRKSVKEVTTVEIDDEDTSESATSSPQWYLRPEEETRNNKLKEKDEVTMKMDKVEPSIKDENNRQLDTPQYVEITIEDSPLKTVPKHPDIGKELTITIDDSPLKPPNKVTKTVESDSEMGEVVKDKQSKKKLDYPKECMNSKENQVLEIEIDLQDNISIVKSKKTNIDSVPQQNNLIFKENNKSQKPKTNDSEKSLKNKFSASEKFLKVTETENVSNSKTDSSDGQSKEIIIEDEEFHPTYQKFIDVCFQLEDTDDMKKIVDKKIKSYYKQCPKDYVESEEFIDMVSSKIVAMTASPEKMYLYIKDVVDELNLQRKMTKAAVPAKEDTEKESSNDIYIESQFDGKRVRQIRKLEKTIKKLHRAIQKLEEQEVDFDDDEDSVYLLTERYKERMVRVHAKFCQLTNTKLPSAPRVHIEAKPGRPTGPAKRLEKWINSKGPKGTLVPFPDFHDVLRCVRVANEEDKLGWTEIEIMEEARDLFVRCGKKLQRRRQENDWRIAASIISKEVDPAENSIDLKKRLEENKTKAVTKETELLNKYVDRQNLLKLEAEEIGDKEAEESPLESEEEDDAADNSLDDKQKRKQRLKRLIKEKSKKDDDKEKKAVVRENFEEQGDDTSSKKVESNEMQESLDKEVSKNKSNDDKTVNESKRNETETSESLDKEVFESKSNDNETVNESTPNETESSKDKEEKEKVSVNGGNGNKEDKENEDEEPDSDNKVESDIDELHLLQKLHSGNEINSSTLESSDSDSPIAISDTLESDSDVATNPNDETCDVISIENSSYSESEMIIDGSAKGNDSDCVKIQKVSNESSKPEDNYALEIDSPDTKENDIDMIQEDLDNTKVGPNTEEETDIKSPKDIVDLASASDVNSVESTDLQTDNDNKEGVSEHQQPMDVTEYFCSENTVNQDICNSEIQNILNTVVTETENDQLATTKTRSCEINMEV